MNELPKLHGDQTGQEGFLGFSPVPAGGATVPGPPLLPVTLGAPIFVPSDDPVLRAMGITPPAEPSKVSSAQKAKHSSVKNEHYTPKWLVEDCRTVLEWFDLDPASDDHGNKVIQAAEIFTKDDDTLSQNWNGRVFLNPPGGRVPGGRESLPGTFWRKLMNSHMAFQLHREMFPKQPEPVGVSSFIWIGFTVEQLAVLQKYHRLSPLSFNVCVFRERIAFDDASGSSQDDPTHANFVCYSGTRPHVFEGVFSKHGKVVLAR